MPLFSVIVPIFNASPYLRVCLDSVLSQKNSNFELICINDGSLDDSLQILNEYKKKDNRVIVIDKENEGVSIARNVGIKRAKGIWIAFLDADDFVEDDWLVFLDCYSNYDIIEYGYSLICGTKVLSSFIPQKKVYNSNIKFIESNDYKHAVWNYFFKRSIVELYSIEFPAGINYSEDQYFLSSYLLHVNKISSIDKTLYNYRQHSSSAVSQGLTVQRLSFYIQVPRKICIDFSLYNSEYSGIVCSQMLEQFLYYLFKSQYRWSRTLKQSFKECYNFIQSKIKEFPSRKPLKVAYNSLFLYFIYLFIKLSLKKINDKFS